MKNTKVGKDGAATQRENTLKGLTPASTKQAVERAVGVCKKVVSAFSNSWKTKRELTKAQAALGLPQHQLITESPTRWGSQQLMIARFLEQEKAVSQVLLANKKARHLVPSWQDMALLKSLNKALAPLFEFTDALSGEKYVSVSFLKPVLHLFNNDILSRKDGDTELTQAVKEGVLKYLNEKYYDPTTDNLLDMATLADPRFKTAYMKEERVGFIKMRAVADLVGMVGGSTAPESAQRAAASSSPPAAEEDPELTHPTKKKKNLGSYFKKAVQPSTHSPPSRASIELELSMYLQAPVPDSETDPLEWWKQHELNFPISTVEAQAQSKVNSLSPLDTSKHSHSPLSKHSLSSLAKHSLSLLDRSKHRLSPLNSRVKLCMADPDNSA
ncbi:hypothetical protein ACEWY4_016058 [Coilia grayii]|uniref:HAT C-terminal dimerisation domain-containing protein n=1 Tax=Coilia grayii TaxID=363190 RepID=A0ABD1JQK7_9TELE